MPDDTHRNLRKVAFIPQRDPSVINVNVRLFNPFRFSLYLSRRAVAVTTEMKQAEAQESVPPSLPSTFHLRNVREL